MTNQEYLRGTVFGAGFPVHSARAPVRIPRRIEYETGDFSFLLRLEEIQRSPEPPIENVNDTDFSIFENRQSLNQKAQTATVSVGFSLEEFERDMDLLAEGLEHLPRQYRGTYSREDIYVDDD
jgi:hypothetical protein